MNKYFAILMCTVATSAILPLCAGTDGVEGLARRVVGDKAERFAFVLDANRGSEKEYFVLSSREDGKIVVKANSVSAQCAGLGWYLSHVAKVQVFWEGVSRIPETLPPVAQEIRKETPYRYRVAFNYCAHSYSLAFADKARWEREIDILALHGVNLPLAITGIECVWYETLLSLGWSDEEARAFIVGPAFMAWQWMTNIESYGGPIPKSWLDSHLELGRFIIGRELELGMKPIQQGFTGNVPRSIAKKYPNADVKLQPKWCGFTGSAQLDPTDQLFPKFAQAFYASARDFSPRASTPRRCTSRCRWTCCGAATRRTRRTGSPSCLRRATALRRRRCGRRVHAACGGRGRASRL